MSRHQLQRIRFVTTYYDWLQGLRFVPFGLVLLGFAAWMALPRAQGVGTHEHMAVAMVWTMGGLLLATVLYPLVGVYYRRRFGVVRRSSRTQVRMHKALVMSTLVGLVAGVLAVVIRRTAHLGEMPLSSFLFCSALSLVWYWHWSGRVARHYLGVATGFALLAVLHAVGASPVYALLQALPFTTHDEGMAVTLTGSWGLAVVVMGVLDHRLLARTLGHEPEAESEEAPG